MEYCRLDVDWKQQKERASAMRMVHRISSTPEGSADGLRRVYYVCGTESGSQSQKEVLLWAGYLLEVGPLVVGGLVTVYVPNADAVTGRGQRAGHGLKRSWAYRRDNSRPLTRGPPKGSCRMCRFRLVVHPKDVHHAGGGVGAEHLTDLCRAVTQHCQVGRDTLAKQPEYECF